MFLQEWIFLLKTILMIWSCFILVYGKWRGILRRILKNWTWNRLWSCIGGLLIVLSMLSRWCVWNWLWTFCCLFQLKLTASSFMFSILYLKMTFLTSLNIGTCSFSSVTRVLQKSFSESNSDCSFFFCFALISSWSSLITWP